MKHLSFFLICIFSLSFNADLNSRNPPKRRKKNFKIYNAIWIGDKPNLLRYGVSDFNIIYEDSLLDKGVINYEKLAKEVMKVKKNKWPICLDIETWDMQGEKFKNSIPKYLEVYNYFKRKLGSRKIGYYGILPYRDLYLYKYIISLNRSLGDADYKTWETMNMNILPLSQKTNVAFPSFYTRGKDLVTWKKVFDLQIKMLKKLNPRGPVYGFIWPQYWHNDEFVSADHWRLQLETLYEHCDGIVIWCPPFNLQSRKYIKWNNEWEWWKETVKFINEYKIK